MADEGLYLQVRGDGIAVITWSNGENKMRASTARAWNSVLDKVESNQSVKAVIITGSGRFFCFGLDTEYFQSQGPAYALELRKVMTELDIRLTLFPIPTVAVINGHAFGAGAFLALSCDYRVMRSDRGWLSWPETVLGMRFAPRRLGHIRTKFPEGKQQRDAILFSKKFSAAEAKKMGLVDIVTEKSRMMEEALGLINETLGKSGLKRTAVLKMKRDIFGNNIDKGTPAKL